MMKKTEIIIKKDLDISVSTDNITPGTNTASTLGNKGPGYGGLGVDYVTLVELGVNCMTCGTLVGDDVYLENISAGDNDTSDVECISSGEYLIRGDSSGQESIKDDDGVSTNDKNLKFNENEEKSVNENEKELVKLDSNPNIDILSDDVIEVSKPHLVVIKPHSHDIKDVDVKNNKRKINSMWCTPCNDYAMRCSLCMMTIRGAVRIYIYINMSVYIYTYVYILMNEDVYNLCE
jgi:hypothetical protein